MNYSLVIKILLLVGIALSIVASYKVMIVDENFTILVNEDGRPLLDE